MIEYHWVITWLVVWNMNFMTFHSVGNFIIPTVWLKAPTSSKIGDWKGLPGPPFFTAGAVAVFWRYLGGGHLHGTAPGAFALADWDGDGMTMARRFLWKYMGHGNTPKNTWKFPFSLYPNHPVMDDHCIETSWKPWWRLGIWRLGPPIEFDDLLPMNHRGVPFGNLTSPRKMNEHYPFVDDLPIYPLNHNMIIMIMIILRTRKKSLFVLKIIGIVWNRCDDCCDYYILKLQKSL